ncbi:SepM family pheromone-processing serine protease [Ornithinibacillus sp. 4-3]|uniref:endopeptidase La n=1 Tax=Ornithinibacillus sp. 4-3 TaxID=3231488 RepID=A0AB39HSB0_9BACI
MKNTIRRLLLFGTITVILAFLLSTYKLPYYVYQPGSADPLTGVVEVEGATASEGQMHLVTVSGGQATPIRLLAAKLLPHHEIRRLEDVRPEGWTDEQYWHAQLQMMDSAQKSATVVAYEAAGKDITIEYDGVYVVSVVENMPADGKLMMGDRIVSVDGREVKETSDLVDYVTAKSAGDTVEVEFIRDEEPGSETLTLAQFEDEDKVGVGIQLVADRQVKVQPEVTFSSGNIGGPSAGLIFALEIYDQLIEEDLTKGYQIVATGELDFEGNVIRIGGIDKKVVAADRQGCDIFFVPNENGAKGSNYEVAQQTAEEIKTDMEIVPVDTFQDAVDYMNQLDPK